MPRFAPWWPVSAQPVIPILSSVWQLDAACAGSALDSAFPQSVLDARTFIRTHCDRCPVARQCLAFAKGNGEGHGVWGGKLFGKTTLDRPAAVIAKQRMTAREVCVRGHDLRPVGSVYNRPDGRSWECMMCRAVRHRARKALRAAQYADLRKVG